MTDQDNFDNFIARAARDIDSVPETPRDEMWAAITAARAEARAQTIGAEQSADVISLSSRQPTQRRNHAWLPLGAAAAAILVLGIGIDRIALNGPRSASNATQNGQQIASNATSTDRPQPDVAANQPSSATTPTTTPTTDRALENLNKPPIVAVAPEHTPGFARAVKSNKSRMNNSAVIRDNGATSDAVVVSYRYAASKHFARVQTLLVTLPVDAREGHINEIAVRAADLLVNTRLLLDSPAARDTETKRLLEDLELILAQAATISPTHSAEDVQMIQDAITKHDALLRLRAITAGPRLSGT